MNAGTIDSDLEHSGIARLHISGKFMVDEIKRIMIYSR